MLTVLGCNYTSFDFLPGNREDSNFNLNTYTTYR